MNKAAYASFYPKYYEIEDADGNRCHGQYLTEQQVENMRARGFKLRLQRDHGGEFR